MAIIELYKSGDINTLTQVVDETVIPIGKRFRIIEFHGETPSDGQAAVIVIWDDASAKDSLWAIQNGSQMPAQVGLKTLRSGVSDGIKKLTLCLSNNSANRVYMSGYAKIWVED